MTTATNGVLANAVLSGVNSFEGEPYDALLEDPAELATANMALGALVADLGSGGVNTDTLFRLREEAATLAMLVGGDNPAQGSLKDNRREELEGIARVLGHIPQVRLETAVEKVKRAMGIGSFQAADFSEISSPSMSLRPRRSFQGMQFLAELHAKVASGNSSHFDRVLRGFLLANQSRTIRQCWEEVERNLAERGGVSPRPYPYDFDN